MTRLTLLGLAGLLWASPADALNRPKKEPDVPVRGCPEVGDGYVRLPGSSICIKGSGLGRVEGAAIGGSR